MKLRRRWAAWLASLACLAATAVPATDANAAWPMHRHDAQRAGAATGTGNISSPTAYWRSYLGGAIGGSQLLVADVAGTGKNDLLFATSGQLVAKDPAGNVLWQTPPRGITQFSGIGDLDGDGILDVVAQSSDHVIVLSVRTGAVEWTEPDGEMGTIGAVRMGDVNGDGKPDVFPNECGCCGVNNGNTGVYWSFGNGFANPVKLGTLPSSTFACGSFFSSTLVQADTSPQYETLIANYSQFSLVDDTGTILAQTANLGSWMSFDDCTTANIDGSPGDEIVCLLSSNELSVPRQITALHYDYTSQPPKLSPLWSSIVAPATGGNITWIDPLVDLDGDGLFELVVSTDDPTNGWQTHIYDALTGADLVTPIGGQTLAGTAALQSTTNRVVLTSTGITVSAWSFARMPSPSVTPLWTRANAAIITYPNVALAQRQNINSEVLATDLNGDGIDDVVLQNESTLTISGLIGFSGVGGHIAQVGAFNLPSDVNLLTTWIVPGTTLATPQVALARSSGVLNLLDGQLQPTSTGTPPVEVAVQFGGYYATGAFREPYHTPRVATLGSSAAQSVLVDDSRSALLRLDAANASIAVPPTRAWQITHTYGPTVVPGSNGASPSIACLALTEPVTTPPQYRVREVDPSGSVQWDQVVNGIPLNDLAPGNFNGDAYADFALQLGNTSNADLVTVAFSGSNGSLLWSTMPFFPQPGGTQSAGMATGPWSFSSLDNVYFQGGNTFVLGGPSGAQLASGGPSVNDALPILYDTSGSGQYEVLLTATQAPVSLYSNDLQTALWTSTDSDKPYPYGAIAQCAGPPAVAMLVEGSWAHPARLKFTPLNGGSIGAFSTVVLAGGQLYPTEAAATAAGAFLGQLTAANVHSNLTGQGRASAVVGSSDGWLYAVNPCSGTLDFAYQVGASVGEAVFGDTDGDGKDEILVTAADGYLYDLKGFSIAPPGYVWDTDPPAITNHDVDSIVTTNKLSATWAAVPGASSYAVQVVTASGQQPVSMPLWKDVGNVTAVSLPGLPLQDGARYLFAVRAIAANGPSVDAISNGVTVHFPGGDAGADGGPDAGGDASVDSGDSGLDGGRDGAADSSVDAANDGGDAGSSPDLGGGGCGCRVGAAPSGAGWFALLLLMVSSITRRRRSARGAATNAPR